MAARRAADQRARAARPQQTPRSASAWPSSSSSTTSAARNSRSPRAPRSAKQGQGGHQLLLCRRPVAGPAASSMRQAREIAASERLSLRRRIKRTQIFLGPGRPADRLSELARRHRRRWRIFLGAGRGPGAAPESPSPEAAPKARPSAPRCSSRRSRDRTQELWDANQALKAEAESSARPPRRSCARSRRWRRSAS